LTDVIVECWMGVARDGERRIVRLAGRLSVAQVPELLQACSGATGLTLDLTELVSADAAGIEALQRARNRGATLAGATGYLQLKIDAGADR
jgi:anti-anti-sigma regulatory factor